jgi:hypothetical protein
MAYGAVVLLEPFLLLKSHEYHAQVSLQRMAVRQGLSSAVHRVVPMMPLREEKLLLTLSFMLCAAVGIAVSMLGGFHVYLTCTAQTTIEFHGNWAARKRAKAAGGPKWKNPYSHGSALLNWQQVYGSGNFVMAMLPSRREPEFLPVPVPGASNRRNSTKPSAAGLVLANGDSDTAIPLDAGAALDTDEHFSTQVLV